MADLTGLPYTIGSFLTVEVPADPEERLGRVEALDAVGGPGRWLAHLGPPASVALRLRLPEGLPPPFQVGDRLRVRARLEPGFVPLLSATVLDDGENLLVAQLWSDAPDLAPKWNSAIGAPVRTKATGGGRGQQHTHCVRVGTAGESWEVPPDAAWHRAEVPNLGAYALAGDAETYTGIRVPDAVDGLRLFVVRLV
jgi:hypothetical protein